MIPFLVGAWGQDVDNFLSWDNNPCISTDSSSDSNTFRSDSSWFDSDTWRSDWFWFWLKLYCCRYCCSSSPTSSSPSELDSKYPFDKSLKFNPSMLFLDLGCRADASPCYVCLTTFSFFAWLQQYKFSEQDFEIFLPQFSFLRIPPRIW